MPNHCIFSGTSVAVGVLSKILKIHDAALGVLATSSKVLSSMLYGLAPTRTWFFVGPVLDFFGNSGSTVVRSMGTKVVEAEKVGTLTNCIYFILYLIKVSYFYKLKLNIVHFYYYLYNMT